MFGRFFDYNGDGESDLFEIVTGMNAMGLFDDPDEEIDDEYEDEDDW
ncbi:MAG: hypothetical protein IJ452_00630 [Butyricicoccus sp.]|nr:hypothetical protein [Butyricicoccus sp.]MBQ8584771.1 hypothetical protein [Butyricicoccus sp.]